MKGLGEGSGTLREKRSQSLLPSLVFLASQSKYQGNFMMDIPKKSSSCNRAPAGFQQNDLAASQAVAETLERILNDMLDSKEAKAQDAASQQNALALSVERAVAKYEGRLHRLNEWFDSEIKRVPVGAHITAWLSEFNKRKSSLESWNHRKLRTLINETPIMPAFPIPSTDRVEGATTQKLARSKVASSASPVRPSSNIAGYARVLTFVVALVAVAFYFLGGSFDDERFTRVATIMLITSNVLTFLHDHRVSQLLRRHLRFPSP